ncbi:hypothetical protein WN093_09180 [Gammaproteobacteria bacterium AS21]
MNKSIKKVIINLSTLALATMISSTNFAATPACKGQIKDACSQNNACAWVNSYTRKDGKTIKSYCRNSAKSKVKKNSDDMNIKTAIKTKNQQPKNTALDKTEVIKSN